MIDCHSTKELMYKRHFVKLDLNVLKELLKQYQREQDNDLDWNGMEIETLEWAIEFKREKANNYK
ncbi:hypothetical protein [uncultured Clostridium sp.]|uniref:hypothetical protein n=1 Tax=uncultured Clostridium sp. TaxID=59620 RepID=UPI0026731E4D|nr:hypothetical protein [uncultured Clostridium sp.]